MSASLSPHGQEGGIEAPVAHGRLEVIDRRIATNPDTHRHDAIDLGSDHVPGEAIGRDPELHHPTGERRGFVDHHLVSEQPQMVGRGQASGPRPDDQHAAPAGRARRVGSPTFFDRPVAQEALDGVDADRLVDGGPVAGGLARMEAGPAQDGGEGVVAHDLAPGRLVGAVLSQVEPLLDVLAGGAGIVARRQPVHVHRALDPPAAGLVGQAGADLECDGEGLLHHAGTSSESSNRL